MEKPNYYAILTADVRYDNELSSSEKLFFAEITALCSKTGECWAGNKYFSDLYGKDVRTITRWVKKLEERGYIKSELVYKDGTSLVDKRVITIPTKMSPTYGQKCENPTDKNVQYNSTSINNTRENSISPSNTSVIGKGLPAAEWFERMPPVAESGFSWAYFARQWSSKGGFTPKPFQIKDRANLFVSQQELEHDNPIKPEKEWHQHFRNWLKYQDFKEQKPLP